MFEELYTKGACDIIRDNADIDFNEEIKLFLCNSKLYSIASTQLQFIDLFNKKPEMPLFQEVPEITFNDLIEYINTEEGLENEKKRCFMNSYELFEKNISEIIIYIHYKKPQIVLNKENSIKCSELLGEKSKEDIMKELIEKNVNSIMYSKNIKEIIEFIVRYSKSNIDKDLIGAISAFSKIRNALVHRKGNISKSECLKLEGFINFENLDNIDLDEITITLEVNLVGESIQIYREIIKILCSDLEKIFEK
ncbi:hypothetical protein UT300007_17260 [Clostridium sp. CTA-7]